MLQRIPAYRDPLVQVLSDALKRALDVYRREMSAGVSVEFECRLGTFSTSRHTYTHSFPTHTTTPALLEVQSITPFFFFAGVAQPTFQALHTALKTTAGVSMPARSTTVLSVRTAGKTRLEYAMNATCNTGRLIAVVEKERILSNDIRCPRWASDFRVSVSREKCIHADAWGKSQWATFTPSVSRLRQRKTIRISPILSLDIAMVRSFTDHTRFAVPWSPELRVPFISAPQVSYDVELEVNLPLLYRTVKKTRLLDSTVERTSQDVLAMLQFLTLKRENVGTNTI
ncbi:mRNA triphosphatase Cet1-like [Trypanosoma melophagium]|uniref:mRNA triphosphatase Cet1-like n=1 Tax=Trypanosoma melophagium TaxID=715481 RepID=UPI00351AA836|nr:mRNA triphosphatase Cet1-like [Trypanosoma melophagium]